MSYKHTFHSVICVDVYNKSIYINKCWIVHGLANCFDYLAILKEDRYLYSYLYETIPVLLTRDCSFNSYRR